MKSYGNQSCRGHNYYKVKCSRRKNNRSYSNSSYDSSSRASSSNSSYSRRGRESSSMSPYSRRGRKSSSMSPYNRSRYSNDDYDSGCSPYKRDYKSHSKSCRR